MPFVGGFYRPFPLRISPSSFIEASVTFRRAVVDRCGGYVDGDVPETNETNNQTTDLYVVTQAPIFRATFSGDAVDASPGPPEIGSWTLNEAAGTIRVRSAFGDLTDKPVELNQVGGTGGVDLYGNVTGTPPSTGVYVASWRFLVHGSAVGAVFVVRDNAGRVLAALNVLPGGVLRYNNTWEASWPRS